MRRRTAVLVAAILALSAEAAHAATPAGKIVYASDVDGDFEIFVMRADGTRRRQITHNRVDDRDPSWAPTGDRVVFERYAGFWDDLYIADLDGGRAKPFVITEHLDEGEARWSPDGEWIAYRGRDGSDGSDIVAERVDNSEARTVVAQEENSGHTYPAWSPDGASIALIRETESAQIAVVGACCDQSNEYDYVTNDDYWKEGLDWSPDGSCLAYGRQRGRSYDLYTVPSYGGTPARIVGGPSWAWLGSWSPDSSEIVFSSNGFESWDLYTVAADGTGMRRLTKTPKVHEITPDWWAPPGAEPISPPCGKPAEEPDPGR